MKSYGMILTALLAGLMLVASVSCYKEGTTAKDPCKGNRAPEVAGPYILKNNVPITDQNPTFAVNETVGVAISFKDKDCNLAGGKIWAAINVVGAKPGDQDFQDYQPIVYIPKWANCEGIVDNNPQSPKLGFDVRLNSGKRVISVGLEDACGARSTKAVETIVEIVKE